MMATTLRDAHALRSSQSRPLEASQQSPATPLLTRLDHLVYATPDLDLGIDTIEKLLGVRATPGGQHPGLGTRNALVALGPSSYLEIIGPDPEQPKPPAVVASASTSSRRRASSPGSPRAPSWRSSHVAAAGRGVTLGPVTAGSRRRPDGVVLSWRYTDPNTVVADGLVPFFIDWGTSPHPSASSTRGATLVQRARRTPRRDADAEDARCSRSRSARAEGSDACDHRHDRQPTRTGGAAVMPGLGIRDSGSGIRDPGSRLKVGRFCGA